MVNRSQFATGSQKHRDPRYLPHAFTEYGAFMAANILNSPRAVAMSIYVIRAFVEFRQVFAANANLAHKLAVLEKSTPPNAKSCSTPSGNWHIIAICLSRGGSRNGFDEQRQTGQAAWNMGLLCGQTAQDPRFDGQPTVTCSDNAARYALAFSSICALSSRGTSRWTMTTARMYATLAMAKTGR